MEFKGLYTQKLLSNSEEASSPANSTKAKYRQLIIKTRKDSTANGSIRSPIMKKQSKEEVKSPSS